MDGNNESCNVIKSGQFGEEFGPCRNKSQMQLKETRNFLKRTTDEDIPKVNINIKNHQTSRARTGDKERSKAEKWLQVKFLTHILEHVCHQSDREGEAQFSLQMMLFGGLKQLSNNSNNVVQISGRLSVVLVALEDSGSNQGFCITNFQHVRFKIVLGHC